MKKRLTRLDHIYTEQLFYFLTMCSAQRQSFFAHPSIKKCFYEFANRANESGIRVGRYVLMPDHLHFFVIFSDQSQISLWIKSLKNTLSKVLRELGYPSPHWQKGYHDHLVRSEESYDSKWEYVLQNPVRKNLVKEPSLWPYQGEIHELSFH